MIPEKYAELFGFAQQSEEAQEAYDKGLSAGFLIGLVMPLRHSWFFAKRARKIVGTPLPHFPDGITSAHIEALIEIIGKA
ncbi:hypothetical protein KKD19_02295 [Patescibacteria group bacterium]|nr:hypothetical protein [Patescibacteria group bacterium]MBU4512055.1 hypothetical protein [Patescibacteria group bacterium]MCG2692683.1 hypothetical protein [Candidatus Parcubacteria bacterium]